MLGRARDRGDQLAGQRFDGALPLGEQLEDLETPRARDGLADAGELAVKAILEGAPASVGVYGSIK